MKQKEDKKAEKIIYRATQGMKAELHLQQYPLFCLTPEKPTDTRIVYKETIKEGEVTIARQWTVYMQPDLGWPGQHEAEVWRAIEYIIYLRLKENSLINPITTSFMEIRKYMSGKGIGGTTWDRIYKSLSCLQSTSIEANFFFYSGRQIREGVKFSLISSVKYLKKKLNNGREVMDKVVIELPQEVFDNIKNHYVRPLDKGFRDQLVRWAAKRLYELLGVKFYALKHKNLPYCILYSRVCGLVGIKQQPRFSWARRILGRAHVELQKNAFLGRVEWHTAKNDPKDWVLRYWPGPRAEAEWDKDFFRNVKISEPLIVEQLPEDDSQLLWVEDAQADESSIVAQVISDALPLQKNSPEEPPLLKLANQVNIDQIKKLFEHHTGMPKSRWNKTELDILDRIIEEDVTFEDVDRGMALCVAHHRRLNTGREIMSLAYMEDWLRKAKKERMSASPETKVREQEDDKKQREKKQRELYDKIKREQSPELQAIEGEIKGRIRKKVRENPLIKELILVEYSNELARFLAPTETGAYSVVCMHQDVREAVGARYLYFNAPDI